MYIVAHHFRHNPAKEYEYSHQHQTFDSARLVFISMKYFILVSRPKLGFFHAAVFLAASFIGVQGGTIKEPIKTWEKNGWFFSLFLIIYSSPGSMICGVFYLSSWLSFCMFQVFNVLCLTCNHRYVEEGLLSFSYGERLESWKG